MDEQLLNDALFMLGRYVVENTRLGQQVSQAATTLQEAKDALEASQVQVQALQSVKNGLQGAHNECRNRIEGMERAIKGHERDMDLMREVVAKKDAEIKDLRGKVEWLSNRPADPEGLNRAGAQYDPSTLEEV
jgi:chromosome segregation ATPase